MRPLLTSCFCHELSWHMAARVVFSLDWSAYGRVMGIVGLWPSFMLRAGLAYGRSCCFPLGMVCVLPFNEHGWHMAAQLCIEQGWHMAARAVFS